MNNVNVNFITANLLIIYLLKLLMLKVQNNQIIRINYYPRYKINTMKRKKHLLSSFAIFCDPSSSTITASFFKSESFFNFLRILSVTSSS